jgi:hypothetical protein
VRCNNIMPRRKRENGRLTLPGEWGNEKKENRGIIKNRQQSYFDYIIGFVCVSVYGNVLL